MLSKKYKNILESIAEELQKCIGIQNLNNYDIDKNINFFKDSECNIKFENTNKTIYIYSKKLYY